MTESTQQQRAKRYEAIRNTLFVVETIYTAGLLVAFLLTGLSRSLALCLPANPWLATAVYAGIVTAAAKSLFLPLNFFGDFYLEHRFGLSNESFGRWTLDELKSLGLSVVLGAVVLDAVYFLLRRAGAWWWVGAGVFFLLFGIVLSTIFPVVILPMFYKLQPLENESLKQKLVALAQQVGAKVLGVYRMGMS